MLLPNDFGLAHAAAIALIGVCWFGYSVMLAWFGRGSLNTQLVAVRLHWMTAATQRPAKPFDAVLLGHIINSIAFFGSATLIVLAGMISSFASLKALHQTVLEVHFVNETSLELFALQLGVLALVLAICFFSFTYALRKLIYTIALIGALPDVSDECPTREVMIKSTALVLSEAIKTFNFGIRGYYYAIAAIFMLASPYASMLATLVVTASLYYRQLLTPSARAIEAYVEAAKSITRK